MPWQLRDVAVTTGSAKKVVEKWRAGPIGKDLRAGFPGEDDTNTGWSRFVGSPRGKLDRESATLANERDRRGEGSVGRGRMIGDSIPRAWSEP